MMRGMMAFGALLATVLVAGVSLRTQAQVRINEVCSKNDTVIADADGDYVDFIELFNPGPNSYDLTGHFLSSNPQNLQEWAFPSVIIPANEFLLVFASGKNRTSPDLHSNFRLSRSGETITIVNSVGTTIDQLDKGILRANHSYGRFPDGGSTAFHFTAPTPGDSNLTEAKKGYAPNPSASALQGFYEAPFNVFFSVTEPNISIHYTRDGSTPLPSSPQQTVSLVVDSTSIIRMRAFGDSLIPSETVTNTYFIQDTTRLPVVSIATDPGHLFDVDTGVYVFGNDADTVAPYWGANFWDDREVPVHVEFYDEDRVLGFAQDLGLKIHGWVQSRAKDMKSLQMIARGQYGAPVINYRLFPDKRIRQFKRFVLRNSGGDFNHTHLRDGFLHQLMIEGDLHVDLLAYRPAVVYVNGEFWGIHNIREKTGEDYIASNYIGLDADNLDVLENDTMVDLGDFEAFNAMYQVVMNANVTTQDGFQIASSYWDMENLADYYIGETFWNNFDWPYWNVLFWRERTDSAKWRYFLVDLDVSLNAEGWASDSKDNLGRILRDDLPANRHLDILQKFLQNTDFRTYFINRYADLINTTFSTEHTTTRLDALVNRLEPDMYRQFERWGNNTIAHWHSYHLDNLTRGYLENKPQIARDQVQEAFNLDGQIDLTIKVWPPEAGTVQINSLELDSFPWSGVYFNGNPVTVTIQPRPGFNFKYKPRKNQRVTRAFTNLYPEANTQVVTMQTAGSFVR